MHRKKNVNLIKSTTKLLFDISVINTIKIFYSFFLWES